MLLRDVMTPQVEDVTPQSTLKDAAEKMRRLDVGSLPVCENRKVIGMITDRDIAIRAVAEGRDPTQAKVGDSMSRPLFFCYEDEQIEKAVRLMEREQIRRLPIFDRQQRLCGIVSLGDLATRLNDQQIGGEVLHEVSELPGMHAQA